MFLKRKESVNYFLILKEQTFEAGCKMSEHVKKEGNRRTVEIDIIYKVGSRNI